MIEKQENLGTATGSLTPTGRRYSIFGTFTELLLQTRDSNQMHLDYFSHATFTMMILNKICSRSWILGSTSFCFQMILGSIVAIDQFKASKHKSIINVPFKVDTEVCIFQFVSIILCLSIQSDILTSIKTFTIWDEAATGNK